MFTLALFLVFGFPMFSSVYLCADRDFQVARSRVRLPATPQIPAL